MGSITSHESSQNVSLMNAAVCTTRKPSPPHSSRRTKVSALLSMAAFSFSISSSSSLSESCALAPATGSSAWIVFATCITNLRIWVKFGSIYIWFLLYEWLRHFFGVKSRTFLQLYLYPKSQTEHRRRRKTKMRKKKPHLTACLTDTVTQRTKYRLELNNMQCEHEFYGENCMRRKHAPIPNSMGIYANGEKCCGDKRNILFSRAIKRNILKLMHPSKWT